MDHFLRACQAVQIEEVSDKTGVQGVGYWRGFPEEAFSGEEGLLQGMKTEL